jgi:ACS family tartrate transporter-like MFS transporter
MSDAAGSDPGASLRRKIDWRVLYPLLFLEMLNFLDRVNVSFASLQMNGALGLSPKQYGFGVGLFAAGYVLFQLPSIWALKRFGMRRWLCLTVSFWGVLTLGMAFIHTVTQFYVLRAALGVAEAGFAAGAIYYVTLFAPRRYRAAAISATMIAVPISVIFGGPLSGWLMSHPLAGFAGWRWMFLAEGAPALLFAAIAPFWFADHPRAASWLSAGERDWLARTLAAEDDHPEPDTAAPVGEVFLSLRVWIAGLLYFCLVNASNGIVFWLPQVVKPLVGKDDFVVGLVSALPWVGIALGMVVISRRSDRTQERAWHIIVPALVAAAGIGLASLVQVKVLALGLLIVGGIGLGGAQSVFWTIPTRFLSARVAATGIAFIAMVSAIFGPFFPYFVGWLRETTGSFQAPILFLAASLVLAAALTLALKGVDGPQVGAGRR